MGAAARGRLAGPTGLCGRTLGLLFTRPAQDAKGEEDGKINFQTKDEQQNKH